MTHMNVLNEIDQVLTAWGMSPQWAAAVDQYIAFALILIIAFTADALCRKLLLRIVHHMVRKTKATWDDIIFDEGVMRHLSRIVAPLIITLLMPIVFAGSDSKELSLLMKLCDIYILLAFILFINALLRAVYTIYSEMERFRNRPLKGLLQTGQVLLWFVGGIVGIAILIGRDPLALLAGLGASAAILMLVFKDSIMGVVSGVQLSANDMLKVGDWITMPKYGADGSVIEVTLNTVKVQNWDKTITTIPPYALVSDSFQNWRGMRESGGRRVKRSISIDMSSVGFCTPEQVERLGRLPLLAGYDFAQATNLGVFRRYLTAYLRSLPTVNQQMMVMVRQLQPTEHGLPLELYFFTDTVDWVCYEGIQADVFDHLLAIVPQFGLRVFQAPAGSDLKMLSPQRNSPNPC